MAARTSARKNKIILWLFAQLGALTTSNSKNLIYLSKKLSKTKDIAKLWKLPPIIGDAQLLMSRSGNGVTAIAIIWEEILCGQMTDTQMSPRQKLKLLRREWRREDKPTQPLELKFQLITETLRTHQKKLLCIRFDPLNKSIAIPHNHFY